MQSVNRKTNYILSAFLALAIISCIFIGESMAGKGKGGDDIILYNGNIVVRGGGKKGKGGGSIVVANSQPKHHHHHEEYMPHWGDFGHFGRRK